MVRSAAAMTALEVSPQKSAPVKLLGSWSRTLGQEMSCWRERCLVWALMILSLSSGACVMPRQICLSKRPARMMEGSRRSGRLVAPITKTWLAAAESICWSSSATMRSMTWLESPLLPRLGMRASSSSMKTMQGLQARARSNTPRTFFSLSPTYMLSSSGPFTLMKLMRHSLATHFPSSVLPVPGGPQNSSPVRGRICSLKISGCLMGSRTVCTISSLAVSSPPTSSQLTEIRFSATSCFTSPRTCFISSSCASSPATSHDPRRNSSNTCHPNLSWNCCTICPAAGCCPAMCAKTCSKMRRRVGLSSLRERLLAFWKCWWMEFSPTCSTTTQYCRSDLPTSPWNSCSTRLATALRSKLSTCSDWQSSSTHPTFLMKTRLLSRREMESNSAQKSLVELMLWQSMHLKLPPNAVCAYDCRKPSRPMSWSASSTIISFLICCLPISWKARSQGSLLMMLCSSGVRAMVLQRLQGCKGSCLTVNVVSPFLNSRASLVPSTQMYTRRQLTNLPPCRSRRARCQSSLVRSDRNPPSEDCSHRQSMKYSPVWHTKSHLDRNFMIAGSMRKLELKQAFTSLLASTCGISAEARPIGSRVMAIWPLWVRND